MNKHFYRIIFNKARGIMMVVAEIVKRHQGEGRSSQKATSTASSGKVTAALKPLSFLTFVALGMVSVVTQSQASTVIADNSAAQSQRPTIIERPNGPTVVNIQEANKAGVSHNKYNQFDVSREGVILNNSAQSSNTQLGGNIAGNSNLANSGSAKVILNEINSANASQLNGKIEVAGQKAQVVIANAAGITCNGCGFINADRATLTTGSAIIGEDGDLQGYHVEQGNITINGEFDSREQDYTGLIARTVNVNGQIYANNLAVVAGKNKVEHKIGDAYDSVKVEKIYSNDDKPQLAIDVAALGGMYANKIKMTSTESGVGVRNAGTLGAYGDKQAISIATTGKITNTGKMYLADPMQGNTLESNGNKITINGSSTYLLLSSPTENDIPPLYPVSDIRDEESYYLGMQGRYNDGIRVYTNDEVVNEGDITISISKIEFRAIELAAKKGINNSGTIIGKNDYVRVYLEGAEKFYNSGTIFAGNRLEVAYNDIYNSGTMTSNRVINFQDGYFYGGEYGVARMVNTGDIIALGQNLLYPSHAVGIYVDDFYNEGNIIANDVIELYAGNFNNSGKIKSNDQLTISTETEIYENGEYIMINEGKLNNKGKIEADKRLVLAVNTLENSGNISSGGELNIGDSYEYQDNPDPNAELMITVATGKAQSVNNQSGTIEAKGDLTISVEDKLINSGLIQTNGTMAIAANGMLINSGRIKSADTMNLALNMLNNTDGQIYSGGAINIGKDLNEDGTITGRATMVNNLSGSIEAADDITIDALYYLYSTD
ncbi:filamentous hemagglutinin N-terminal domain-containing protein [Orbus sturtevantii]|uniref:two-partner secretion domain-containing protein n=1 Tax=Orbus sturtevantii TaxID=3074109 RepID=UPI00370D75C9